MRINQIICCHCLDLQLSTSDFGRRPWLCTLNANINTLQKLNNLLVYKNSFPSADPRRVSGTPHSLQTTLWESPHCAAAAAKSLQSCPTLCDPRDGSPSGSPFPGILQARTLEWVAISFPNAWKWKVKVKSLSRVRLLATPRAAAHQAPPSMGFSRQEYWSGVPSPSLHHTVEGPKKDSVEDYLMTWKNTFIIHPSEI